MSEELKRELEPIKSELSALSAKYRDGGDDEIGWEILQAIRALDKATALADLTVPRCEVKQLLRAASLAAGAVARGGPIPTESLNPDWVANLAAKWLSKGKTPQRSG